MKALVGGSMNSNASTCSVVTASYGTQGRVLGAVGVIGPTRMAYERVIPVVQATAGLLSDALNRAATAS